MIDEPIHVISDLDSTLLGDSDALARFARWVEHYRPQLTLTYATGRTVVDVMDLVEEGTLPTPDHIIGSVGTEIFDFEIGEADRDWPTIELGHWCGQTIDRELGNMARLRRQPERFQSEYKVSYFLPQASEDELVEVRDRLDRAGIVAEPIYSAELYLDVLPVGVDKGAAAKRLVRQRFSSPKLVIVCGDSENDLALMHAGYCGVLVGNASPQMRRMVPETTYQSPLPYAAGVLDGIHHWVAREVQSQSA